ncbi:MAG: RNA 2',3'-cyclic phosphodiesterase [Chloroflexi bacterium]|nr:RNA 2',3'-cyclic phosphodiesterase [Chloroflexota bacterium]
MPDRGGDEEQVRAFIAIELPSQIQELLGQHIQRLRAALSGPVRWMAPPSVHLTLKFLGNVPGSLVPTIGDALERACRGTGALELRIGVLGCFPNPRRARVLWLDVEGDREILAPLQARIDEEMVALGFDREGRAFVPHLTLARVRGGDGRGRGAGIEPRTLEELITRWPSERPGFTVTGVSLMSSILRPEGAVHRRLAFAGLKDRESQEKEARIIREGKPWK